MWRMDIEAWVSALDSENYCSSGIIIILFVVYYTDILIYYVYSLVVQEGRQCCPT